MKKSLIWLLPLLPVAATPFFGTQVLLVSGFLLFLLLIARFGAPALGPGWWGVATMIVWLLASIIGLSSAIGALVEVGGIPAYGARLGFAWATIGLALLSTVGGIILRTRPVTGSILLLIGGIAGTGTAVWFYINTYYPVAGFLWCVSAVMALLRPRGD